MATLFQKISLAFGALVLLVAIAVSAAVVARSIEDLGDSFERADRPTEIIRTLLRVRVALADAETAQRGYLLTGEAAYFDPYEGKRHEADSLLTRLDTLVSGTAVHGRELATLRTAIGAKQDEMDEVIRLYRTAGPDAALALVRTDRGVRLMEAIRAQTNVLRFEAIRERSFWTDRVVVAQRRALWATALTNLVLFGLIAVSAVALRRLLHARDRANETLRASNVHLAQAVAEREAALVHVQSMQAQMVQQEKLAGLGRLTAGVAHELKNPLNFINNFAELAAEMTDEAIADFDAGQTAEARAVLPDVRDNVGRVLDHGRRADDIVRTMLVHARGVSGDRAPVDVAALVETAAEQAVGPQDGTLRAVHVECEIDPAIADVTVLGIPSALTRLFLNLIENAVHATRERAGYEAAGFEPFVRVEASVGRDRLGHDVVHVTIADNGAGVSDVALPRIFEPFYTTKAPGQGTGLGLSLAYDIAVGHGGSLAAGRSEAGGALFTVTLPLAAEAIPVETVAV
ncbi:MAG TPA: CHASE3 domain-containing protein [Rubricoccaceae bacterium]